MKKFFTLILVCFASVSLWAYDFESGNLYYKITDYSEFTVEVTYQLEYDNNNYAGITTITIPERVYYSGSSFSVTSIGHAAFCYCSNLTSITIPNSVTSIESNAFNDCYNLTRTEYTGDIKGWCQISFESQNANPIIYSNNLYITGELLTDVVIPKGVIDIKDYAFNSCYSLTSITIPEGCTSIGQFAFSDCSYLTSITIPNSVTSIGNCAFSNCSKLTSITIPNSVTSIGSEAFSSCSALTSITIPNSVTSIGNYAFQYCSTLTSVTIGSGVEIIGEDAFRNCYNLTEILVDAANPNYSSENGILYNKDKSQIIHIPQANNSTSITIPQADTLTDVSVLYNLTKLENIFVAEGNTHYSSVDGVLYNKDKTTLISCPRQKQTVTIPNSVTSIGEYAFYYCSALTSITIPNSITSIGYGAFRNCSSLTSITIPNSVTSIGSSAFSSCTSLTSITIPNSVTSIGSSAFYNTPWYNNLPDGIVYINNVLYNYKGSMPANTTIDIKDGTVSISPSAFSSRSNLTAITIPNSVTSIGSSAFYNCSALTSITIPNSVTSIGNQAFYNCSALTSITIPEGIKAIDYQTFYNCSALTSITWNAENCSDFTGNWNAPFYNIRSQITEFIFGDKVQHIPAYLCYDMTNVSPVKLPNSITSVGTQALYNVPIANETSTDGVIYAGSVLMGYQGEMPANTTIHVKEGTTAIYEKAFYDCKNLISITIPNSVQSIGREAFYGCSALTSINIPEGVKAIENSTFYGCSSLTSITIPNSVTSIGQNAFSNCSALTSINIPEGVNAIKWSTFSGCSSLASITIPNSVTSIETYAFSRCSALTFITIPNSVTSIGFEAFGNCSALTSVNIPDGIKTIETQTFYKCSALTSITIPNSVTSIGSSAFSGCYALTSITWNAENCSDFTGNWNAPFYNIRSQITEFIFGDKVQHIPAYLCYEMNNLPTITIPNSVTSIGDYAFYFDSEVLMFESEVPATIGQYSVFGSNTLLIVPSADTYKAAWTQYKDQIFARSAAIVEVSTTAHTEKSALHQKLGLDAFQNIVCLKINGTINSYDIMMLRNQMPHLRELDLSDASIEANTYEYAKGYCSKNDTLTAQAFTGTGTKITKMILPKSLKYIATNTFNSQLKDLTILGGKLAESAFENSNIQSVTLSDDVKAIAPSAFKNCDYLKIVNMGNGVQTIGSSAFYGCESLPTVTLPKNLLTINQDAFYGCSALQTITLPETLETIGKYAFQGAGLRAITIPANVSSLGVGAFAGRSSYNTSSYGYYSSATSNSKSYYSATSRNNSSSSSSTSYHNYGGSLREVTIPKESKLKTIPSRAFEGNESLTKLSILGDSITSIADVAFRGCALDTLILPPNLTSLSTLSFGYCTGLKFIAMPNSLTEIPHNAFVGCTNLNDIQFPRKLTHIGHHAFADCSNLSNVDIPGLVTSIGDYAFKDCNVNSVYSYLFDPFTIGQNTFSAYANANAILYVPNLEDTEMKYLYDTQWSQFLHRVRMDKNFEYDDFYANGDVVIGDKDDPLNGDPNANLNPGSGLVVEGDSTQNLGTVILTGEPGDWASILAGCNLNVDTLILQLKVTGHQWHFFGFPFEIKISDIFTEGNFVIYEYDGAIRAERDTTGWKKLPTGQDCLYPGHGYIFQFDFAVDGYFSIKLNKPNFCKLVELINLFIYPASNPHNQSWNYVSNPFLAYYDINDLNYTGPITFWDELLETYQTYRPGDDEYYISPYEAFFLQNANLHDNFALFFDRNKAMTKKQRDERSNSKHHLPAKKTDEPARERFLINLLISDGTYSDQTRVVINSNASLDYELGVDAAKFLSTEKVPQLFSYDADHAMCAINERPMDNGTVQLGIQLPKSGTYSISAARMDTTFYLFDKQENITHDFQQGDYYFDAKSGLNDQRFELVRTPKRVPTAIEDINTTTITPTADGLIVEGNDYIQIYSMTGVMMAEGQLSGLVQLPNGVYVVVCNGNATKHTVQ